MTYTYKTFYSYITLAGMMAATTVIIRFAFILYAGIKQIPPSSISMPLVWCSAIGAAILVSPYIGLQIFREQIVVNEDEVLYTSRFGRHLSIQKGGIRKMKKVTLMPNQDNGNTGMDNTIVTLVDGSSFRIYATIAQYDKLISVLRGFLAQDGQFKSEAY